MSTPAHPRRRAALRAMAAEWLACGRPAVVVHVARVRGSTPRETDARMLVGLQEQHGTIGGGHLEWQAVAMARQALQEASAAPRPDEGGDRRPARLPPWTKSFALGPTLGQCCGGAVDLHFAPLTAESMAAWPLPRPRFHLDLHGAGHVGQALVQLLADLDCEVRWIDQRWPDDAGDAIRPRHADDAETKSAVGVRDGISASPAGDRTATALPTPDELAALPAHVHYLATDDAVAEVPGAPEGSAHLVITHRHDLDLALVDRILRRPDVLAGRAWVGMIGSATKRAAFERRLRERGHGESTIAQLACPIGVPGIVGKEPAVIAIAAAAQLLQRHPPVPGAA